MGDLKDALEVLKKGQTLLYPTDTVWGLGCDATNFKAVKELYKLKNRPRQKSCICLVSDIEMLKKHIEKVPEKAYNIIRYTSRPTTIVYTKPVGLAENLIATNNTIAIRVVSSGFCHRLISDFEKPIVSTSANYSGEKTPLSFEDIPHQILKNVGYAVTSYTVKSAAKPSVIIDISGGDTIRIIRD